MQLQQRQDTARHVVPRRADSVRVRITGLRRDTTVVQLPGTLRAVVQVPGSLHATTRQVGFDPLRALQRYSRRGADCVTVWAHLRTHKIEKQSSGYQKENVDLQAKYVALQREFNEMQVKHEKERREDERRRDEDRRRATDARSSGTAFALRRQLISWIDQTPQAMDALLTLADSFADEDKKAGGTGYGSALQMPTPPPNTLNGAIQWSRDKQLHFDRAEQRMLQLVAAAPDGSPAVAESIRRIYVLFYQATSRINQQVARVNERMDADAVELAIAYHEIERCIIELRTVVGGELLIAEELIARGQ